jgi:hypothetical protein
MVFVYSINVRCDLHQPWRLCVNVLDGCVSFGVIRQVGFLVLKRSDEWGKVDGMEWNRVNVKRHASIIIY